MATHLRRQVLSLPHLVRLSSSEISGSRSLSTDAVVELKSGDIGMVSGIPQEHLRRKVVIYSPARTATQQGSGKVGAEKLLRFMGFILSNVLHLRWENPLMGWTSTGDPYANVGDAGLSFNSSEAAASFAEKHGWDYVVKKRHTPVLKPKAYADNFKWTGPPRSEEE
ncbi:unnamed protein product [Spirodela intermedia]|uniref:NADH dehydrogenase [ubiquinone] iron-sulfur protein 4, mitochondrial n=1 Tax=Spirodela intermedia TaxID=51605 RepID=A0A7I8I7K9_SPIIN|nr:unnamed protein product [Spirodela intermedia]CAA6653560.1 unnamed protein product [Spirodela intermedia]